MNSKFDFLLPKEPEKEDFYGYGTVVQVDPLMVHIDGDDDDVTTPANTSLDSLAVGNRVYVTIRVRQLIVLGVVGGTGITTEQASSVLETTAAVQAVIPKKPLPPDNFAATTPEAYTDSSIGYLAKVTFSWSPVTEDTDGNPVEIKAYEIWDGTHGKQLIKSVSPTDFSVTLDGFSIYEVRTFYIRAIAVAATTPSDYAPALGIEVDFREATTPVPPIPSTPILSSNSAWSIDIKWDGTFTNAARPTHDFRGIYIYAATTAFTSTGDTGVSLIGTLMGVEADSITVSRPVGTWYIAFQSFSNAGKKSALSATASAASQSIFDTTPQLQEAVTWIDTSGAELDTRLGAIETLPKVYHGNTTDHPAWNTDTGPGTFAAPVGSTWFQHQTNISGSVIAQYTKTGAGDSDWAITDITSEVIANLDVGKLTAGTGTMIEATIEKLWTDVVRSRSITTDMLLVGSGLNLIPNGILDQKTATGALSNVGFTSWTADTDAPEGAQGSFLSTTATTKITDEFFALEPDTDYVLSAYVKGTLTASFYVKAYNNVDTVLTDPEFTYTTPDPDIINRDVTMTASWVKHEWSFTTPAATAKGKIAVTHAAATQRIGTLRLQKKMGASLIVDGAISAKHIDADSIRTAILTAGSIKAEMLDVEYEEYPGGPRITIKPNGLELYSAGDVGEPTISITTSSAQTLSILDQWDQKIAGMDADGNVIGKAIMADTWLSVGGVGLSTMLYRLPRGVVAKAVAGPSGGGNTITHGSGESWGWATCGFTAEVGRMYRIMYYAPMLRALTGTTCETQLRYTQDGSNPSPLSPVFDAYVTPYYVPSSPDYSRLSRAVGMSIYASSSTHTAKLMVCSYITPGTSAVTSTTYFKGGIIVEDIGINIGDTGWPVTNQSSSTSVLLNYTKTESPLWKEDYSATAYPAWSAYTYKSGVLYQGAYGSYGPHATIIRFPTQFQTDISGATNVKVEVYLKNIHSYSSQGMTALIGSNLVTSSTTVPSTIPAQNTAGTLAVHFAKGEGKWVDVTSAYSVYGITLTAGTSTSTEYYGYFDADSVLCRWSYTK